MTRWRFNELKCFVKQYPEWKKELNEIPIIFSEGVRPATSTNKQSDPTGAAVVRRDSCTRKISLVERCAKLSGQENWKNILEYICSGTKELRSVRVYLKQFYYILDQQKD